MIAIERVPSGKIYYIVFLIERSGRSRLVAIDGIQDTILTKTISMSMADDCVTSSPEPYQKWTYQKWFKVQTITSINMGPYTYYKETSLNSDDKLSEAIQIINGAPE
jgi:hypothetical protein